MRRSEERMNIANKLTTFRMLMIPVFIVILCFPFNWGTIQLLGTSLPMTHFVAAIIFAVASLTDFLDGYLARKLNLVTSFGAFFDPMADKLLVISALIILVEFHWVSSWIVFVIIARELMVTGLRVLIAQSNGKVLSAALPGKIKTFSQMFAILFYLLHDMGFASVGIPMSQLLMWICLFFTIYSGIDYFWSARFVWQDK